VFLIVLLPEELLALSSFAVLLYCEACLNLFLRNWFLSGERYGCQSPAYYLSMPLTFQASEFSTGQFA